MRIKSTVAALLAVASAIAVAQQGQNPFVGRWNLRGTGPDTDKVYWLEVMQKGDQLEGRFLNRSAHATPLYNVYSQVAYATKAGDVQDVFVNGRTIVLDRKMLTLNASEVERNAREWQKRIETSIKSH